MTCSVTLPIRERLTSYDVVHRGAPLGHTWTETSNCSAPVQGSAFGGGTAGTAPPLATCSGAQELRSSHAKGPPSHWVHPCVRVVTPGRCATCNQISRS